MVENVLPRPDVPPHIAVDQQPLPSRRAGTHEQPDQDRQKEQVRERRDQPARPSIRQNGLDTAYWRPNSGEDLWRGHVYKWLERGPLLPSSPERKLHFSPFAHTDPNSLLI